MPIEILNSRCRSQILLNQNIALRSLSQSLSKSDFYRRIQLHSLYFIFVQFISLPVNFLFFHHTCHPLSQHCLFSVFNQSKKSVKDRSYAKILNLKSISKVSTHFARCLQSRSQRPRSFWLGPRNRELWEKSEGPLSQH